MKEPPDCHALLSHAGWVRTLARHLARDAHAAEDLAQDAMAAALVHSPPDDRPLRAWLGGIVRNLARMERRSAGARSLRERSVAREEAQTGDAELLERIDTHRALVEAVMRLRDPYRAAILMRYFDGLAPWVIASRTGVPVRTVHTRLRRALVQLRGELDGAHHGDRGAWLAALIPIAKGSGGKTAAAIGAILMDVKLKAALVFVAVAAVCSTIVWWPRAAVEPETAQRAPAQIVRAAQDGEKHADSDLQVAGASDARRAEPVPAAAKATEPAAQPAAAKKLGGRVIDVDGAPVRGVTIAFVGRDAAKHASAVTDDLGRFEMDATDADGRIDVATPGWTSLFRPEFMTGNVSELVLVVSRSITVGGTVLDERRRPIASATVALPFPIGLRARFDAILDKSTSIERSATTDDQGRFELKDAPALSGAKLETTAATFQPDERPLQPYDDVALEIGLKSTLVDDQRISGVVVDDRGDPVEGAWVGYGDASTQSGARGAFTLDLRDPFTRTASDATRLVAVKQGHLPGELLHEAGSAWPDPIVVRLGPEPLVIDGRVVDASGKPVAGAEVWTSDETHFGYVHREGSEMSTLMSATVEGLVRDAPFERRLRTDSAGHFTLRGLLQRDYRVHVLEGKHMLAATVTFAAGSRNVEIRLPHEAVFPRVAGRVTHLSGEPVVGAQVCVERKTLGAETPENERIQSRFVATDKDGRFEFTDVSTAVVLVRVQGEDMGLEGFVRTIDPKEDVEHLEIAVPMDVRVQVEAIDKAAFDSVSVLDAKGEKLFASVRHGTVAYGMLEVRLQDGRTEPFTVSESAKTLVLSKQGAEVRRAPLALAPGKLNTIRQ